MACEQPMFKRKKSAEAPSNSPERANISLGHSPFAHKNIPELFKTSNGNICFSLFIRSHLAI